VFVKKRPGVDEFMKWMSKCYELIIYTASLSKYADPVLDFLDKERYCSYRLFWEHCTFFNGIFVKDLSRLDWELFNSIIIDNSPTSYFFHTECAVPITSWYDDPTDDELTRLIPILESLSRVDDVWDYLKLFIFEDKVHFAKAS